MPKPDRTLQHGRVAPHRRRPKAVFRLLALALAALSACAIGEVALRCAGYSRSYVNGLASFHESHALVGWRGKPEFVGRFHRPDFDVTIAHNELGFRRHEHQNPPSECRHKVFVLGDSFTWGWGVAQGEVFTDQMSLRMPGYDVENYGLTASGTVQQFFIFDAYVRDRLSPGDTVVLQFYGNDFDDNVEDDGGELYARVEDGQVRVVPPAQLSDCSLKNILKDYSYLFNLMAYCADLCTARSKSAGMAGQLSNVENLGDDAPAILITTHFLAEFQKACPDKGARFVVAYVPGQAELGEATHAPPNRLQAEHAAHEAFRRCAESARVETIELLPYFLEARRSGRCEQLTFPADEHWNQSGHAVAAEVIARSILDAGSARIADRSPGTSTR